jgi:hypothetical protein
MKEKENKGNYKKLDNNYFFSSNKSNNNNKTQAHCFKK